MKKLVEIIIVGLSMSLTTACTDRLEPGSEDHIRAVTTAIDHQRMLVANDHPEDWLSVGRNYAEDRYSELSQITRENVNELGLAWIINLGIYRGIEATPVVVDGIMFVTGPWSIVYAIDVRKGEIIWIYDPEVPRDYGVKACSDVVNRGVSMYKGMIYVGTIDGRLVAIEAATGEMIWETLTVDQNKASTIIGATRVFDGKVLIGNGGGKYGVRGYVTAYDALSGAQLWRFYTVPGNPVDGFESKAMVYDPELNLIYIGTGKGSPRDRNVRSPGGVDKLYLSSIVALNPDNGEMVWYYQQIPGETFDFSSTQSIILADLEIDGRMRKVLMQAPKNGFFNVIDRTNGALISAEPFVYVNWASGIDEESGRPMAYNPTTGLVYIPARESSGWVGPVEDFKCVDDGKTWNTGLKAENNYGKLIAWDPVRQKEVWSVVQPSIWNGGVLSTRDLVFQGDAEGMFRAFDASNGEEVWSYDLGTGIMAAPCTYMVDGIQYISVAVGWGGAGGLFGKVMTDQVNPGTVYTFALGRIEKVPDFEPGISLY